MTDIVSAPEAETEFRGRGVAIVRSEPRVYSPGSDHSWFQDLMLSGLRNVPGGQEGAERLQRYAAELDKEIAAGSLEGRRAERIVREAGRSDGGRETRAITSTSSAGFTTPEYLIEDWAAYRSPNKSFTDQTTKLPLPPYGLQVNVPSFTGPATNVQQAGENQGITQATPTGSNIPVSLVTIAGEVSISQQLFDRGGLSGPGFDKILLAQILAQQDAAMDTYVIGQALANAGTVTDSSFSMANFYADLALARELLADTAGVRLLATHLFTTSDLFGYLTRQLDSSLRPILVPDSGALVAADATGDPKWNSWTGIHLGQLRLMTDANVPAIGANTQILVARPSEIFTFDGENYGFSFQETAAQTLTVTTGLRTYVGAVVRFPKCVASISGTAYSSALV